MGNIIGENIDLNVREQIEIRQQSLSFSRKENDDLLYQNKTSWLRLASSVNLDYKRTPFIDVEGQIAAEKLEKKFKESVGGDVSGNALARRFVLFNTLAQYNEDGSVNLREGFNPINPNSTSYTQGPEGYKPNPGLEGAQITFYNRGSLSKAIIQIKCFTPEQLDILEFLYMRVGYTILLEWGHTSYLNNLLVRETFTDFNTEPLQKLFNNESEFYEILTAIQKTRTKHHYNYDGFYGKVTNFNWTYNNDGTYNITVTAISVGDIIESLNINKNFNIKHFPDFNLDETGENDPIKNGNKNFLDNIFNKFKTELTKDLSPTTDSVSISKTAKFLNLDGTKEDITFDKALVYLLFKKPFTKKDENEDTDAGMGYIKLGYFLSIIQDYFLLYNKKSQLPIFRIDFTPESNYCLSFFEQVSSNPSICVIPQSYTSYLKDQLGSQFFVENNPFLGRLMEIHVNMDFISELFRTISKNKEESKVPLYDLIQGILSGINDSLGGINKFEITFDSGDNILIIREDNNLAYKGLAGEAETITKFDVKKLGSFVKNVSFNVQISNAFASMVSIGAQANGNIVGEDATSLSKMYKGAIDRTYKEKLDKQTASTPEPTVVKTDEEIEKERKEEEELNNKLNILSRDFYNRFIINPSSYDDFTNLNTTFSNKRIGSLANNNEIPPQGFLPFDLQLEFEGISGIKIYQKFNITDRILPSTYRDDNGKSKINFVIKGISHEIKGNVWDTTIQSMTIPAEPNPYTLPKKPPLPVIREINDACGVRSLTQPPTVNFKDFNQNKNNEKAVKAAINQTFTLSPPESGKCARFTYNHAKNFSTYLKLGEGQMKNNKFTPAGGNANNKVEYWANLVKLGYKMYFVGKSITRDDINNLTKTPGLIDWQPGDICVYYAHNTDKNYPNGDIISPVKYGHTQIYRGNNKWDSSVRGNYNTGFVYNSYNGQSVYYSKDSNGNRVKTNFVKPDLNCWDFIFFRAPVVKQETQSVTEVMESAPTLFPNQDVDPTKFKEAAEQQKLFERLKKQGVKFSQPSSPNAVIKKGG
tara:strand:- start:416 stop:3541 length:3126 start_codon:yes stop_codon:yes gene_type:complete